MNLPFKAVWLGGIGIAALVYWKRNDVIAELPATGDIPIPFTGSMTRNDVRIALRSQAEAYGFNANWFDAIAKTESNWKLDASNNSGPDSKYGGAWGPMQMLSTTLD